MTLHEPLRLRGRTARNRIVFGSHETNLGRRRSFSERHVAYYRRRAAGGVGVVTTETASVHAGDWPYERAPLAFDCAAGWAAITAACHDEGALVLASIGHAGGQGSSAYSQQALWAPSAVPEVASREVPKVMEEEDIAAVVAGFGVATAIAVAAGCDGVEIDAGQLSIVRQFLSGLTNLRDDGYGEDRLRFAREVLLAVRAAAEGALVALRLCCDELAPWAGIVPAEATRIAVALTSAVNPPVDLVTAVRGSLYTPWAGRPDGHTPPGFGVDLARALRTALPPAVTVVAQGSLVDVEHAEQLLTDGAADAVEMTRAQIADPDLAKKARRRDLDQIRPCVLCNQTCQVRDPRNPIVTCVGQPTSGYEAEDARIGAGVARVRDVLVVGGGPAGLEAARIAALLGHHVRLVEGTRRLGGLLRVVALLPGHARFDALADWLERECRLYGVALEPGTVVAVEEARGHAGPVVVAAGGRPGAPSFDVAEGAEVAAAAEVLLACAQDRADALPAGPVVVWDPVGGPVGVGVAEVLLRAGREVALVTPDLIVGNNLSRSGDLATANARLLQGGARLEKRTVLQRATLGVAEVHDRFTGEPRELKAALVVDAGHRLPADPVWRAVPGAVQVGDSVAPRSVFEAILEGRRAALTIGVPS